MSVSFWLNDRLEEEAAELRRRAEEAAKNAFLEAVERKVDRTLPLDSSSARQWPVSTYLGECSREAQAVLFEACHLSAIGRSMDCLATLDKFTKLVAAEYAADNAGVWK